MALISAVRLKSHLKVLKSRKVLFERNLEKQDISLSDDELIEVANKNLNSMLLGRFNAKHVDEMKTVMARAAEIPLKKSLPIWHWFIENINRRLEHSPREVSLIASIMEASLASAELACYLAGCSSNTSSNGEVKTNLFRYGDRNAAFSKLRNWVREKARNEILISDPYFGPDELEFIKIAQEEKPDLRFRLLLSDEYVKKYLGKKSYDVLFQQKWDEISDQEPPRIDIVIVGVSPRGSHPIHDRWIVSENSGIRVGTSLNSIGFGRTSEISDLTQEEFLSRKREIESYLNRAVRTQGANKISYKLVDM